MWNAQPGLSYIMLLRVNPVQSFFEIIEIIIPVQIYIISKGNLKKNFGKNNQSLEMRII